MGKQYKAWDLTMENSKWKIKSTFIECRFWYWQKIWWTLPLAHIPYKMYFKNKEETLEKQDFFFWSGQYKKAQTVERYDFEMPYINNTI